MQGLMVFYLIGISYNNFKDKAVCLCEFTDGFVFFVAIIVVSLSEKTLFACFLRQTMRVLNLLFYYYNKYRKLQ